MPASPSTVLNDQMSNWPNFPPVVWTACMIMYICSKRLSPPSPGCCSGWPVHLTPQEQQTSHQLPRQIRHTFRPASSGTSQRLENSQQHCPPHHLLPLISQELHADTLSYAQAVRSQRPHTEFGASPATLPSTPPSSIPLTNSFPCYQTRPA